MKQKSNGFVSEIDQFLKTFDQEHPDLSVSQKKEKAKFQRIEYLRKIANRTAEPPVMDDWFNQ